MPVIKELPNEGFRHDENSCPGMPSVQKYGIGTEWQCDSKNCGRVYILEVGMTNGGQARAVWNWNRSS